MDPCTMVSFLPVTMVFDVAFNAATAVVQRAVFAILARKLLKELGIKKQKLISNRDSVLEKVEATNETEKVNDAVVEWLNDAEKLIEEEEKLEIELETRPGLRALHGSKRRYWLYKGMLKKIKKLNTKCEFEPFSSPIPDFEYFSSSGHFEYCSF